MKRVLFIFGTRPEAIKLCPLVACLRSRPDVFDARVCVTAQHREMLDQVLEAFSVAPDYDLDLMQPGQTLATLTARILLAAAPVLETARPDVVVVQGDTTTTLAGALAAFYQHIPVAHVEAGLRTGDMAQPFPEEMNRVLTSHITSLHFAPTARARAALLAEGVSCERIFVTGNTGVDAVLYVRDALDAGRLRAYEWPWLDATKRLVLVTSHRRENFGAGFERSMRALAELAARGDAQVVYPVHRNPNVACPARAILGDDFVTKPFSTPELLARIRATLRRVPASQASPDRVRVGQLLIDFQARTVSNGATSAHLTPKELDLLRYLTERPNEVVPHRELLQAVWGPDYGDQTEYLRVFVRNLRKKLEREPDHPEYIATEPWVGYRFNGNPRPE